MIGDLVDDDARQERPGAAFVEQLLRMARRQGHAGDVEGETESLRQAVALDPDCLFAHVRLSALFRAGARPAQELPHLEAIVRAGNPKARKRLVTLLCDLGRSAEALPHLPAMADEGPNDKKAWNLRGRCLAETGDLQGAAAAWRRALAIQPNDLEATERLDELERRRRPRPASTRPFTVTVIGNCQAFGLAQCLRRLCPDVDVTGLVWNQIASGDHAERVILGLQTQDVVLSQLTERRDHGALRTSRLRPRVDRLTLFPTLHFTGFHPDLLWLPKQGGPGSPRLHQLWTWHSALVMAAFVRGVPQAEAAELFNAYVYRALGYFDEYAKAERGHLGAAHEIGFDLQPLFARWRRDGAFVHVPNHPVIGVPWSLAELIWERLGLQTQAAGEPPPDRLRTLGAWPVYPELARALGVEGSLRFEPRGESGPAADLDQTIDEHYRAYAECDPESLRMPRILDMVETLRNEGV